MIKTGILLTGPRGGKYFHPCKDAKSGLAEMAGAAFVYGAAWKHPDSTVEFVREEADGTATVLETVETGWKQPKGE